MYIQPVAPPADIRNNTEEEKWSDSMCWRARWIVKMSHSKSFPGSKPSSYLGPFLDKSKLSLVKEPDLRKRKNKLSLTLLPPPSPFLVVVDG